MAPGCKITQLAESCNGMSTHDDREHFVPLPIGTKVLTSPAAAFITRYFSYAQLPPRLQDVSRVFREAAERIDALAVTDEDQRRIALQRLLEAKDAAVRAIL